jgi:CheY-like chemotaxis protein
MNTESKVFYVEDNPDDIKLTSLAMRKAGVVVQLETATDGDQAIAALKDRSTSDLPDCILLDLKLPCSSGLEVLAWIRSQPHLKHVPVIMLTSSLLPSEINQAYELGANSYLLKPSDLTALIDLTKTIAHYWLKTNVRPRFTS